MKGLLSSVITLEDMWRRVVVTPAGPAPQTIRESTL